MRPGTKWTQRGELYIFPTTNKQKDTLLHLKRVNKYEISCSLCKSEQEVRGVMYNVPPNNSEDELLALLSIQGVTKVKRFATTGPHNTTKILPMVALYFNTPNLPKEVTVAHERFVIKKYIPRPYICRKCWTFGQPEESCSNLTVCKHCSSAHEVNTTCLSPPKCPTCSRNDHSTGTAACPIFASKQRIIQYAYEINMSITEAGRLHSNPQQPTRNGQATTSQETGDSSIKTEIENIKKQLEKLQKAPANLTASKEVESRIEKVEKEISTIKTQLEPILKLESQMKVGFTSLDNRITLLQEMLIRDREDRLNRQKEKDKRHALEQLNAKSRNMGTGAPPPTRKKTDAQQKS